MIKKANGFYSRSDSYFKKLNKRELIDYIRTIEKNWENALITNNIQYENCKKLLVEERNKVIDEFVERINVHVFEEKTEEQYSNSISFMREIKQIAEQLKAGEKIENDIGTIIELLDAEPTSYNSEKVIKELEKETIALEDNFGELVECIPKNIAIDIVKRGATNE